MIGEPETSQNWRFGAFEVEGRTAELRRNGIAIRLQEQPSQLLLFLLQHAGQIVTREELRQQLWPADTFVDFDHALNTAVMKLREALGDSSEKPLYIQTLPRKGYRFVAPVAAAPTSDPPPPDSAAANGSLAHPTPANPAPLSLPDPPTGATHMVSEMPTDIPSTQKARPRAWRFVLVAAPLLILAIAALFLYQAKPPAPTARSLTRITFDEGLQSDPTWSPDGRSLAYSADHGGATNIWMQQIGSGDPVQVTTGSGPNWQPDWSPDGKYIVYRSDVGAHGLYVIPAVGGAGQERRVSSFGYKPRWSPDGSQILFESEVSSWRRGRQVYVVGLDGTPSRQVFSEFFRQHSFTEISAAWHPDGKRVTVWVSDPLHEQPTPNLWTLSLDGGTAVHSEVAPQIQQQFAELEAAGSFEWAADSKFTWVASGDAIYIERTFRGARSLWRLNIDSRTLRATASEQLTSGGGIDSSPAISPDGKKLAFTASSGKISAWLYPFDANMGKITGAGRPVTSPGINTWRSILTRDGSKLAFTGVRAGETRLWVKSLPDGHELPLFVDNYDRDSPFEWSPDGTHLAYGRKLPNHPRDQVMVWSAETRLEEPVTSPVVKTSASDMYLKAEYVYDWSADGKSLLVAKMMLPGTSPAAPNTGTGNRPDMTIWQVPLSAAPHAELHDRRIIANPNFALYQPHDSPDGRWIAFEAVSQKEPGGQVGLPSSLYVTRAAGGPWLPIVVNDNWADKPRWSPDGKTIYFLWSRGNFLNVWGIHFDPESGKTLGDPFQVTSLNSPSLMVPEYLGDVEISVSRHNLAMPLGQFSGAVWVLDNVDR